MVEKQKKKKFESKDWKWKNLKMLEASLVKNFKKDEILFSKNQVKLFLPERYSSIKWNLIWLFQKTLHMLWFKGSFLIIIIIIKCWFNLIC